MRPKDTVWGKPGADSRLPRDCEGKAAIIRAPLCYLGGGGTLQLITGTEALPEASTAHSIGSPFNWTWAITTPAIGL